MKKLFYFFAILMALYSLPSLAQGDPSPAVNMDKYITLTVWSGENIKLNFKAAQANTPVRIVSGTNTQDITVGTDWYVQNKLENDNFSVKSDDTTMTIYGDITGFNCSKNRENLTSLDVSKNTQLATLDCGWNNLTSFDVSKNTQLATLYCDWNNLTSLDVSKNTQLATLDCGWNNLTSLDVSKNTQLATLDCVDNELTSLDVSKNTQLATLDCGYNKLTSLDVSKNTQLTSLYCYDNELTSLDVSKNTQLADLRCYGNQLTSLDVSKNTQLATLDCGWNQLTSLDVSKNTQLTSLYCYGNQLTSLDVSKNTQLATLYCYGNQLTSLDVSKNTQLTELDCYGNQLTSLDVSNNTQLTRLWCYGNGLTSLDMSNNTQLTRLWCYGNKFTTESMNELYCSLPDRQKREEGEGKIYPLYEKDDANHETIAAATSDNARNKDWIVLYRATDIDVPSNGNYDCNSGVDEHLASGISVFPNPASGKVQIKLSESVNETLILVDLAGRAVLLEDVISGEATIDVSNLTAGTYFIRIGNITKKLTVK